MRLLDVNDVYVFCTLDYVTQYDCQCSMNALCHLFNVPTNLTEVPRIYLRYLSANLIEVSTNLIEVPTNLIEVPQI